MTKECNEGWVECCEDDPCPRHIQLWMGFKNQTPQSPESPVSEEAERREFEKVFGLEPNAYDNEAYEEWESRLEGWLARAGRSKDNG